jgi:hypothetical protein
MTGEPVAIKSAQSATPQVLMPESRAQAGAERLMLEVGPQGVTRPPSESCHGKTLLGGLIRPETESGDSQNTPPLAGTHIVASSASLPNASAIIRGTKRMREPSGGTDGSRSSLQAQIRAHVAQIIADFRNKMHVRQDAPIKERKKEAALIQSALLPHEHEIAANWATILLAALPVGCGMVYKHDFRDGHEGQYFRGSCGPKTIVHSPLHQASQFANNDSGCHVQAHPPSQEHLQPPTAAERALFFMQGG